MYLSIKVLTIVTNSSNLSVAGFLDLSLVIQKIDLSLRLALYNTLKMDTILNVTFPRSLFSQVFGATMVGSPCLKDPKRERRRVKLYLPKCC